MIDRRGSGAESADTALDVEPDRAATIGFNSIQSAFMARQAERSHLTGLSPIEEMRIAQNELRAKAAKQIVRPLCMCVSRGSNNDSSPSSRDACLRLCAVDTYVAV